MRQMFFVAVLLTLAACQQKPAVEPTAETAPTTAATEAAVAPVPEAGALAMPLPEGFELPFAYNRLNENVVKTEDGKEQHRAFVEFLDTDAASVEGSLTSSVQAKGFSLPTAEEMESEKTLTFARPDGATVVVKINSKPKGPKKAPNAKGTVHFTWTGA